MFSGSLIDVLLLRQACAYDLRPVSLIALFTTPQVTYRSSQSSQVLPSTIDQLIIGIYEFSLQNFLQWSGWFLAVEGRYASPPEKMLGF
jgi:hypothetical protein